MLPSKEKIEEIIKDLQRIMRIQDWDIEFEYVDQYRMKDIMNADHYDYAGCCHRDPAHKTAHIRINADHTAINNGDWYNTLVHEMVHIMTGEIKDIVENAVDDTFVNELYEHKVEVLVCDITKVICNLHPVTNYIKEECESALTCPKCGSNMIQRDRYYECKNCSSRIA